MPSNPLPQKAMVLASAALILFGSILAIWAVSSMPSIFAGTSTAFASTKGASTVANSATSPQLAVTVAPALNTLVTNPSHAIPQSTPITILTAEESAVSRPTSDPRPIGMTVAVPVAVPVGFLRDLGTLTLPDGKAVKVSSNPAEGPAAFDWTALNGSGAYTVTFAAATRFDTIFPETTWADVQAAWSGVATTYTAVSVLTNTLPALEQVLGPKGPAVVGQAVISEVVSAAWSDEPTLALVPFDQLDPELAVLSIDGQTPIENANHFTPTAYPFTAVLYVHDRASNRTEHEQVQNLLAALPQGNRDPAKLTVLTMTGVTAMVRMMADEMDRRGAGWPAEYVGQELSSADITHISNEVPFVEDCPTDLREDNFNFCTKKEYFETLRLSGVDIIGLTGNHQNDFGQQAALDSLDFYKQHNLPVYGGGRNVEEAYKPLYIVHNGNRMAFIGANSYGPEMAWADTDYPGSARFDVNIMSATIRNIKEKDFADVVLAELQYQETYDVQPTYEQRDDFNALARAGADIVTGVQSHVPQAIEFTNDRTILYGLGNLYFDQMWSQTTRENLIYKHTFYKGRHIGTQIETTLLYDFGQPRFMTRGERSSLLTRIFGASYWEH